MILDPLPLDVRAFRGRVFKIRLRHREQILAARRARQRGQRASAAKLQLAAAEQRGAYVNEIRRFVGRRHA